MQQHLAHLVRRQTSTLPTHASSICCAIHKLHVVKPQLRQAPLCAPTMPEHRLLTTGQLQRTVSALVCSTVCQYLMLMWSYMHTFSLKLHCTHIQIISFPPFHMQGATSFLTTESSPNYVFNVDRYYAYVQRSKWLADSVFI